MKGKLIMNGQSFNEKYELFISKLNAIREIITDLGRRHQLFRRKCENNIFLLLFRRRRLRILRDSLQVVYSSFDELNRKRTFIWGMISKACWADDSYISKTFDHTFDEIETLEQKLKEIERLLLKVEKK